MRDYKNDLLSCLWTFLAVLFLSVISSLVSLNFNYSFAKVNNSAGGGINSGTSKGKPVPCSSGIDVLWQPCNGYGGSGWRVYEAEKEKIAISGNSTGFVRGGEVKDCDKNGGFFLLHGAIGIKSQGLQIGMIPIKESYYVGTKKWQVNDNKSDISGSGSIQDIAKELLNAAKGHTYPDAGAPGVSFKTAKKIFEAVKQASEDGQIKNYNFDNKSSLSWFCFDPQKFLEMPVRTKSHVKVEEIAGSEGQWTNQNKPIAEIKYRIKDPNGVATLKFEQYVTADFKEIEDQSKKYEFKFNTNFSPNYTKLDKSSAEVTSRYGTPDINSTSFSGKVTNSNADWRDSTIDSSMFNNSDKVKVTTVKTVQQLKIAYKDVPPAGIRICENIRLDFNSIKFEDDKIEYIGNPTSTQGCIEITKDEEPEKPKPEPEEGFCKDIVDQDEFHGDTAGRSFIINSSKGGGFPRQEELFTAEDKEDEKTRGIRMTPIAGGLKSGDGGKDSAPFLYAKPFDTIQFLHVMCFGALAVKSGEPGKEFNSPGEAANSREHRSEDIKFNFTATPDSNHLWSNISSSLSFSITKNGSKINAFGGNPDFVAKYGAWAKSPTSDMPCQEPSGQANPVSGFAIPGNDGCGNRADVGETIKQTMSFQEIQNWSTSSSAETNPGSCGCNDKSRGTSPNNPTQGSYGSKDNTVVSRTVCKSDGECTTNECETKDSKGNCIKYKKANKYKDSTTTYLASPLYTNTKATHNLSVSARVPYNFLLELESSDFPENRPDFLYPGEIIQPPKIKAKVHPRSNPDVHSEPYATRTPEVKAGFIKFLIKQDAGQDILKSSGLNQVGDDAYNKVIIKGNKNGADLCGNLNLSEINDCHYQELGTGQVLNAEGFYNPDKVEEIELKSLTIPDVDAGYKFCIAAAIYPADSHGIPERDDVPAGDDELQEKALKDKIMEGKSWLVGGAACRTIVKKPSFQVWNGGVFAENITTSLTDKIVNASITTPTSTSANGRFGSWSEFETVATGSINNFASGAALGYSSPSSSPLSSILPLPGGTSPSVDYNPNLIPQTISNTGGSVGSSGISADDTIGARLRARYTTLPNSASDLNSLAELCARGGSVPGCNTNGAKLIKLDGDVSLGDIELPIPDINQITDNFAPNTYVIYSDYAVTIDDNVCSGKCDGSSQLKSIAQIPQLLIFANHISIKSNVKRLDAWLISSSGIDTCSEFDGNIQSAKNADDAGNKNCSKQLTINGPIILDREESVETRALSLNRTAGAYPGDGGGNTPKNSNRTSNFPNAPPTFDLTKDGSITPAEIFHLHPAAYLWAFNQSQRLTQAIVTHSRELPPRF